MRYFLVSVPNDDEAKCVQEVVEESAGRMGLDVEVTEATRIVQMQDGIYYRAQVTA